MGFGPNQFRASLVAQRLKRLTAMRETWVQSLGQEDPLEKEMATYSSILAWRIPWMEEPGGLQSTGSQRVRHDWATSLSLSLHSSTLAWKIPWTEGFDRPQSMGSQRVGHDWATLLTYFFSITLPCHSLYCRRPIKGFYKMTPNF